MQAIKMHLLQYLWRPRYVFKIFGFAIVQGKNMSTSELMFGMYANILGRSSVQRYTKATNLWWIGQQPFLTTFANKAP